MEIERKFTIKKLPDHLEYYTRKEIEQAYLCKKPTVRVRKSVKGEKVSYKLCYKSKLDVEKKEDALANVCEEIEMKLTEESYAKLLAKADGQVIRKTRYIIPYKKYLIELDVFSGTYQGLVFAEVEFETEEEANAFELPDWFDRDVTFDKRFRNSHLALSETAAAELLKDGYLLEKRHRC